MKLVKERLDFNREGDPYQKLGVGSKRPGQPKAPNEVEIGDKTLDYNEEEGIVEDILMKIDDPEHFEDIIRDFGDDPENYEDDQHLVLVSGSEYGQFGGQGEVWFVYGPDGAEAIW